VTVARRKVRNETRHQLSTDKCDLNRERSLVSSRDGEAEEPADPSPPPVEVAIAHERLDSLVLGQSAKYRKIIQLRLQGHTFADIAYIVRMHERTVRRFLENLLRDSVE
jgi:DNA-directed RNA polymerase specialized sigma24 family protein